MVEYIGLLRTASLLVAVLGLILLSLAAFVVWKYDLLDYYRFKTGKGKKKSVKQEQIVSQYYSEALSQDDSHEIINEEYEIDSENLSENITIGHNEQGEVRQIIENDVVDFSLTKRASNIPLPEGNEETTLLAEEPSVNKKIRVDFGSQNKNSVSNVDLSSFFEEDEGIDETDAIPLSKSNLDDEYENDEGIDETDVIEFQASRSLNSSGSEETELLSKEILDETDVLEVASNSSDNNDSNEEDEFALYIRNKEAFLGRSLTKAEISLAKLDFSSESDPQVEEIQVEEMDANKTQAQQDTEIVKADEDGSDETTMLNQISQDESETEELYRPQFDESEEESDDITTLLNDKEGENETMLLSGDARHYSLSSDLWSKQIINFEIDEKNRIVIYSLKK